MTDVDMTDWEIIGIIHPDSSKTTYVLPNVNEEIEYKSFRIVNHESALKINSVDLMLVGNQSLKTNIHGLFLADSASDIFEFPKGPRRINRVGVKIEQLKGFGKPKLYLWGKVVK